MMQTPTPGIDELERAEQEREERARGNGAAPEGPRPLFREIPPGEPFPVDAIGAILGSAALAIHDKIQAPLALCAQSVLATATLAAQAHRNVLLPYGQSRPLSCYFLAVAETGERKSACDTLAAEPIRLRETELAGEWRSRIVEHRAVLAAWEVEWKRISGERKLSRADRAKRLQELGDKPPAPPAPVLVCSEPTLEGLFRLLREGPPSVGVFSNEGGQLIGGHAMNDDNRLKTAAGLSDGWDGKTWKRVRGGDGLVILPNRRVTLNLMAQPLVAAKLLADPVMKDQGILSRVLVTAPVAASGSRFWREPADATDAALREYTRRVLDVFRFARTNDEGGLPALRLAPLAREMWTAFADKIEGQLGPDHALACVRGLANKAAEHGARLAGVLAVIEDMDAAEVSERHLAAGIELVNFYLAEAVRLHAAARTDEELQKAARLLAWLHKKWGEELVSPAEVYQFGPAEFRDKRSTERPLRTLEEHGWVVRIEGSQEIRGKRRREVFRVVRRATE